MSEIRFTVHGVPAPQGSKRAFVRAGHAVMQESSGDRIVSWRQDVKAAALAVRPPEPIAGPVDVRVVFLFARPKGHYRTGRHADRIRPSAPEWPANRGTGDLEKLVRATFDPITAARVWLDDSQVIRVTATKQYTHRGGPLGALIWITPLTPPPGPLGEDGPAGDESETP